MAQHRDDRGDDRRVDVAQAQVAQVEQRGEDGGDLVGRRLAVGGQPPVLHEPAVAEHPDVGLRVADVDRKQHGEAIMVASAERS